MALGAALAGAACAAPGALATIIPGRPLLCLEATDFSAALAALDGSKPMAAWYATASYKSFLDTKLAQKLGARFREAEALAGAGFNLKNLRTVAGGVSALALYDIGALEFLYVSKLDPARFAASVLGPLRGKFDRRTERGLTSYVKAREDGALEFAFALVGDLLFVSNRAQRLEEAMALPGAGGAGSLAREPSYAKACELDPDRSDFRLFLDQQRINASSYFRAYWLFRNAPELGWIESALISASLRGGGLEERRVFLPAPASGVSTAPAEASLAAMLSTLPGTLPHVSSKARPSQEEVVAAICNEVAGVDLPAPAGSPAAKLAAGVATALPEAGFEALARVVGPVPGGDEYYLSVPRGVVLLGPGAAGELSVRLQQTLGAWLSAELTGEETMPALAFVERDRISGVELPLASGRGIHVARGPDRLVLATDRALAAQLVAGGTQPPFPGSAGWGARPLSSLRVTDVRACKGLFRRLVERVLPAGDSTRDYFLKDWLGLLDSFPGVGLASDRTWSEAGVVRQVVTLEPVR